MDKTTTCLLIMIIALSGCAQSNLGNTLKNTFQGQHYLATKEFDQGAETFRAAVQKEPDSATANYYYGRFLLANKNSKEALPYLEKAARFDPDNAAYHFWLGVAYGENAMDARERTSYLKALSLQKNHVPSLLYLGNNYLNAKSYHKALDCYQRVLVSEPDNPQALYNRALVYRHLQRTPEEQLAWRFYLDAYSSGALAQRAAEHLNQLDDFSYRNHRLGHRTVTLAAITFVPFSARLIASSKASLDLVGTTIANMPQGQLNIVVYQKNNRALAGQRARSIKVYLEKQFPILKEQQRLQLSWFDVPEQRRAFGRTIRHDESVIFFLDVVSKRNKPMAKIRSRK